MQEKPTNTETDRESRKKQLHFSYKENKEEHTLLFSGDIKTCQVKKNKLRENYFNIYMYVYSCVQKEEEEEERMKMKSNVHPSIEEINDNVV